jgi:DNA sulfur modification protein DndB
MNENKKIELLGKLIGEKEISKQLKERNRLYNLESIKKTHLESYLEDGWQLYKEFKTSYSVKKDKPNDIEFEDKVWALFASLGYNFLNKDRYFNLPYDKTDFEHSQQIDVFAKDGETIILVECKAASENKRGDFKKELEAMASKMDGMRKSIQLLFPNTKHKLKYILATRNYSISDEDLDRLNKIGGIHFNEETVDYFFSLYNQIGTSAKYQFLGNIFEGQEIPEMENMVPAVEGTMGGHTYYSFSIEPEKLLKICYVLHRNKAHVNMMPTYQRLIKKSRLKSVLEFIEGGGYFPNSIVISIDSKKNNFSRANTQVGSTLSNVGIFHLPKKYRSAFIIDGQHRLYGYTNSKYKNSNTIPVVAFLNLSRSEQIKLFMQINENQKAVSKDLRNTLNADLLWDSDNKTEQLRALCSRISIHLGENRESALFGKISIGEDKKIITTQAIENALKRSTFLGKVTATRIEVLGTFYNGDLDYTYERLSSTLKSSFQYIAENCHTEWKSNDSMLLINKGVYGLIMILGDIIYHLNERNIVNPQKDSPSRIFSEVKTYLDPIINFINQIEDNTRADLKSSYGAGGETKYWRTFQKVVRETHKEFDPDGLDDYFKKEAKLYNDKAISYIRDIETEFKKDFKEKLEDYFGKKWFEKGVPPKIADKATVDALTKNRELDEDDDYEVEPWDCLTIIAYREIAIKNWQHIFEKTYTKPGEEKISGGKEEKTKWMVRLERIRNQNFHSYSVTEEELWFLEELHDWVCKKQLKNKFQLS